MMYSFSLKMFAIRKDCIGTKRQVPDNEITGITLTPSTSNIQRNQLPEDVTINATIKSTGTVDDTLEWEMTGNESTETTMTVVNLSLIHI